MGKAERKSFRADIPSSPFFCLPLLPSSSGSFNEALDKAQPYQTRNFQIFAPKMPSSTTPLCVALHVKNSSDVDKELRIFKQLLCDCSLKKNRLRKAGDGVRCVHKDVVDMRPAYGRVKANGIIELQLTFSYELLGQQEVDFILA